MTQLWPSVLFSALILLTYSEAFKDSVQFLFEPKSADGEWWLLESQAEQKERTTNLEELVGNLRQLSKSSSAIPEEQLLRIEWMSLKLSRQYIHLFTDVQKLRHHVETLQQFLSSGQKTMEIFGNADAEVLVLVPFVTLVTKIRDELLKMYKHHAAYQKDSSRQKALSFDLEQILEAFTMSPTQDIPDYVQLPNELLAWKISFETQQDELIESIKTYTANAGTWLSDMLGDDSMLEDDAIFFGHHLLPDDAEADDDEDTENLEMLESAREVIRVYKEMFDNIGNETAEVLARSEL